MTGIKYSFDSLNKYVVDQDFKGYDPYDTLNSWIPFKRFGKWSEILAIQFQKRNPVNIRPIIGVKKFHSTKGMGLLLSAYLNMYSLNKDVSLIPNIERIKNWLLENCSFYKGAICWGYDYPYTSKDDRLGKGFPTVIHHSYIIKALFEYYQTFKDEKIKEIILESEVFVSKHLNILRFKEGICFSYNPKSEGCCYNASIHAATCLARIYYFTKDEKLYKLINDSVDFITEMQKDNGVWNYSFKTYGGTERKQIDFHQGFILESYFEIKTLLNEHKESWERSIKKGLDFYYKQQFVNSGRSHWRIPIKYPVDIHNQAQGIITFTKLGEYGEEYRKFANKIADWTIDNMQSKKKGFFYYRINKPFKNKIPYMRWSQAWMMLALSELLKRDYSN